MDNFESERTGQFIAELRRERQMTQQELAQALHVTDKAVSKWETGRGFPDIKLLPALGAVLGVSVVELLTGRRIESDTLTKQAADDAACQAAQNTSSRLCRRLQHMLYFAAGALSCVFLLVIGYSLWNFFLTRQLQSASVGIIGGADGPTSILVSRVGVDCTALLLPLILLILIVVCLVAAIRLGRDKKKK